MKVCTQCRGRKPLTAFYSQDGCKQGVRPECKMCYSRNAKARRSPETTKRTNLRKFRLTLEDHAARLAEQKHLCAICYQPETARTKPNGPLRTLSVDHDHKTGRVRGLLCNACNKGLGFYRDSPFLLGEAISYLRRNENTAR